MKILTCDGIMDVGDTYTRTCWHAYYNEKLWLTGEQRDSVQQSISPQ